MTEAETATRQWRPFVMGCITGGFLTVGILGLMTVAGFFIARPYIAERAEARMTPPEMPNEIAEYDCTLIREDGEEVSLSQWKGAVIVLTLWKPGCAACAIELPGMQRLANRVENAGIEFLFVSVEEVERIDVEADAVGLEEATYVVGEDWPDVFMPRSAPATYVIAPDGRIALTHVGMAKWDDPSVEEFLRGLAAAPAPTDQRIE